ncbi:MAG: PilZ domain-containing protein [Myxococcales bacterium FL481]|nr:MAG: PilZ domain-containing protein [Myxococcales bacterium FL481]
MLRLMALANEASSSASPSGREARRYPRLRAPVYCRPARLRVMYRLAVNVGAGGLRIYSDEAYKIDTKLELDMLLPQSDSVKCLAQVVWVKELPPGSPAQYDIGLKFLQVPKAAQSVLEQVLARDDVRPDD